MALSEDEKRERHKEAMRRYREKVKKDPEKYAKQRRSRDLAAVTSFIRNRATRAELMKIKDATAERQKLLNELKK